MRKANPLDVVTRLGAPKPTVSTQARPLVTVPPVTLPRGTAFDGAQMFSDAGIDPSAPLIATTTQLPVLGNAPLVPAVPPEVATAVPATVAPVTTAVAPTPPVAAPPAQQPVSPAPRVSLPAPLPYVAPLVPPLLDLGEQHAHANTATELGELLPFLSLLGGGDAFMAALGQAPGIGASAAQAAEQIGRQHYDDALRNFQTEQAAQNLDVQRQQQAYTQQSGYAHEVNRLADAADALALKDRQRHDTVEAASARLAAQIKRDTDTRTNNVSRQRQSVLTYLSGLDGPSQSAVLGQLVQAGIADSLGLAVEIGEDGGYRLLGASGPLQKAAPPSKPGALTDEEKQRVTRLTQERAAIAREIADPRFPRDRYSSRAARYAEVDRALGGPGIPPTLPEAMTEAQEQAAADRDTARTHSGLAASLAYARRMWADPRTNDVGKRYWAQHIDAYEKTLGIPSGGPIPAGLIDPLTPDQKARLSTSGGTGRWRAPGGRERRFSTAKFGERALNQIGIIDAATTDFTDLDIADVSGPSPTADGKGAGGGGAIIDYVLRDDSSPERERALGHRIKTVVPGAGVTVLSGVVRVHLDAPTGQRLPSKILGAQEIR